MELNDYFPANNVNVRLPEGNGINLPKNRGGISTCFQRCLKPQTSGLKVEKNTSQSPVMKLAWKELARARK